MEKVESKSKLQNKGSRQPDLTESGIEANITKGGEWRRWSQRAGCRTRRANNQVGQS